MRILGISPLDKDATVSIVEDGRILYAAAEERFSRKKQHRGFPYQALQDGLRFTGSRAEDIDLVTYAFYEWDEEHRLIRKSFDEEEKHAAPPRMKDLQKSLRMAERMVPERTSTIPGLKSPNQRNQRDLNRRAFYRLAGGTPEVSRMLLARDRRLFTEDAERTHKQSSLELAKGLEEFGLQGRLRRYQHHSAHEAKSYLLSGLDRALVVTIDGYGSGLAGSVSLGENGKLTRLHDIRFPNSLGSFYENVTAALGFRPDRHAGKIVGLAAYGDPEILSPVLLDRIAQEPGSFRLFENLNVYFTRHLASRFPMIDVAAAYQHVLEVVACRMVEYWLRKTNCDNVVLSGGVIANVKLNQRIHEIDGVRQIFVDPNMGDGGCGAGLALHVSNQGRPGIPVEDVYLGPSYSDSEIQAELAREGLSFNRCENVAAEVAAQLHAGNVIGRFDGRMEYGPRALGNRSILYHASDPGVNQWLNQRLGRTEFMPFAPVTLWKARHKCYQNLDGAEHAAQFMTMTFDCTPWMRQMCPAAVHVDGTARPQLLRRETNPGYYDILAEYEALSGIPCLINTSFNMHEEPIVCSPRDAIRAFLQGNLDGLLIGSFFVAHPKAAKQPRLTEAFDRK